MTSKEKNSSEAYYSKKDISDELISSIVNKIQNIFIELGPEIVNLAGKSSFIVKKDGSPVTELDGQIEDKIINNLSKYFPRLTIFGEESGYSDTLTEVCVLIDPIDGTKSFIENIPSFTSMAVIIVENKAIASVIYNPSSKKMYTAIKNKGAFVNGKKLELNKIEMPRKALAKKRHIEFLNEILVSKNVASETAPSGGGYGFSKVAEGLSAARFQINAGGYIHDYAPGALLVKEAGGEIISLDENQYTIKSKNFIVCHPGLIELFENNHGKLIDYSEKLRVKK